MITIITAERYHDISCGHRVVGHENKCAHLHGHNYRITFTLEAALDDVGRVLDFSAIREVLCEWLEVQWDHKMILWEEDRMLEMVNALDPNGIHAVPFNPTAENMATFLLEVMAPQQLAQAGYRGVQVTRVRVEETRKCSATAQLGKL